MARNREIVVDCASALFQHLGVALAYTGSPDPVPSAEQLTVAVIGLAGAELRGSPVVGTTSNMLSLTYPVGKEKVALDDESLRDWAGELANHLIGRIRDRASSEGHHHPTGDSHHGIGARADVGGSAQRGLFAASIRKRGRLGARPFRGGRRAERETHQCHEPRRRRRRGHGDVLRTQERDWHA